jgi:hypothetical protein
MEWGLAGMALAFIIEGIPSGEENTHMSSELN